VPQARNISLMRDPATTGRVTNIELFFDLVYVFAVTQLSDYLLAHSTPTGALRAGLLLIMVWLLWVCTIWVTNWLGPDRIAIRLLLLGLAGASLVMSAALPGAFGLLGLAAPHVTALALGACTAVVIIAVAVLDYARNRRLPGEAAGRPTTSRKVREIDRHVNDCGLCAMCGSAFPCDRATLADLALSAM
jgi:hypothetical protein